MSAPPSEESLRLVKMYGRACNRARDRLNKPGHGMATHERDLLAHIAALEARAIAAEAAPAAPVLVGPALARPEVQRGEAVVEFTDDDTWMQLGPHGLCRHNGRRWVKLTGTMYIADYALPCRLVAIGEAGRDPRDRKP